MTAPASDYDVAIAGAGLAGLSAARHLHRAGLSIVVCEASDDVGGRVRTDQADGFRLDRGFQVLLPAYPELRRQARLAELRLRPFLRGALAMTASGRRWLAAPWHGLPAVSGSSRFLLDHPGDAVAVAAMSLRDLVTPGPALRAADQAITTGEDLRRRLSTATITDVMRPFLAGVFLDPALAAPAGLFHLLWRCFLRGGAAVPEVGMQALPRQLAGALPPGAVRTNTEIAEITDSGMRTSHGEHIRATAVVVATDGTQAARLVPGLAAPDWHSVTTFYYRAPDPPLGSPSLIVDGQTELLINTAVLSEVAPSYAPAGSALISASVPGRADAGLESLVRERLAALYQTPTRGWELLAAYPIPRALPVLAAGQPLRRPVRVGPGRYVCGDHRDTPSIQGALVSGRRAAAAILADFRNRATRKHP